MKSLKRWVWCIVVDLALANCFYMWQFQHVDGAGNVFMFVAWFFAITSMLMGLSKPEDRKKLAAGPAFRSYQFVSDTAVIVALVWTGHYVTAVAYLIGSLVVSTIRSKASEPVAREAA